MNNEVMGPPVPQNVSSGITKCRPSLACSNSWNSQSSRVILLAQTCCSIDFLNILQQMSLFPGQVSTD